MVCIPRNIERPCSVANSSMIRSCRKQRRSTAATKIVDTRFDENSGRRFLPSACPYSPDTPSPAPQRTKNHSRHTCGHRRECEYKVPVLVYSSSQNTHECLLRDLYIAHLTHPFLSFFLFFQKLFLTGDITAVALRQDIAYALP